MDIIPYYRGSTGLNLISDPTRIALNPDTGLSQMSEAKNVLLNNTGQLIARFGYKKLFSGDFHSLYSDGYAAFVGRGSDLLYLTPDLELQGLRGSMAGVPIKYANAGHATVYCNGGEKGIIYNNISHAWVKGVYNGPASTRVYGDLPFADLLAFYSGRVFISIGPVLYWSELHRPDLFDFSKNLHQFKSDIVMIAPVAGGIYISDTVNTYFLSPQGAGFKQDLVYTAPAIKGTLLHERLDGLDMNLQAPGACRIWTSPKGVLVGLPTGQVFNLNGLEMLYPNSPIGYSGLVGDYYIHSVGSKVYALNYRTHSTTEFINFTFNSIINFNGNVLGANSTGLYQLSFEYTDDDGTSIDCRGAFKAWDFGVPNIKRIRHAYIGVSSDGNFTFTAQGDTGPITKYLVEINSKGAQGQRITMESAHLGRYWTFGVDFKGHHNFALNAVDILPIIRNASL